MRAPTKSRSLEVQVGLFVLLGFFAIAAFCFRLTDSPIFTHGIEVTTYLDDATGLFKLAKVKQAGIPIGFIKDISLDQGRAKLTLVIEHGYQIPKEAKVVPRPMGILGDKYLEIEIAKPDASPEPAGDNGALWRPGAERLSRAWDWLVPSAHADEPAVIPSAESPTAQKSLKSGDVISSKRSGGSMDDIAKQVSDVARDLKATSKEIRQLVQNNSGEIDKLLHSWARMSTKLEGILDRVDTDKLGRDLEDLSKAAGRINHSLEHVENITKKIDEGEGTLGKLVNDPQTVNELNRSLVYLNNAIERTRRTQIAVDMSSDYLAAEQAAKTYVGLQILTRENSGYLAQIVVDPAGTTTTKVISQGPPGGPLVPVQVVENDQSALKFGFQFLRRIGSLGLRLGIFENTGGLGVDYYFSRRLQLSGEVFDLSRTGDRPHVRSYLRYSFLNYFYVQAGGDDLITKINSGYQRRTLTVGLGLRFTDDDIKTALLFAGIP